MTVLSDIPAGRTLTSYRTLFLPPVICRTLSYRFSLLRFSTVDVADRVIGWTYDRRHLIDEEAGWDVTFNGWMADRFARSKGYTVVHCNVRYSSG